MNGKKTVKILALLLALIILFSLASCKNGDGETVVSDEPKISDYFPFEENVLLYYNGKTVSTTLPANDPLYEIKADMVTFADYFDAGKLQKRYMMLYGSSFAYSGEVYELKNGELRMNYVVSNFFDHANLFSEPSNVDTLILKEPLKEGTTWTVRKGSGVNDTAKITDMSRSVTVPAGTYDAMVIEITDINGSLVSTQYWAKGLGIVKQVTRNPENLQTTELDEVERDAPMSELVYLIYGEGEEGEPLADMGAIDYPTNCDLRQVYIDAAREYLSSKFDYTLDENVKINSLELNRVDNKLKIDLSKAFISEMNKAGDRETEVLQALANTMGWVFRAIDVCFTVDGGPYVSNNITLGIDEYIRMTFYQK